MLILILLLALALRLGYPTWVGLPPRTPLHGLVIDEPEYYGAASVLADGRGLRFYDTFPWTRVPVYVLFVGGLFRLAGRTLAPVFAVQAVLSVVTLAGLAWLAGRAAGRAPALGLSRRAAARFAALLGALWLPFTLFANLLLSETLFLLFVVAAFMVLARFSDLYESSPRRHGDTENLIGSSPQRRGDAENMIEDLPQRSGDAESSSGGFVEGAAGRVADAPPAPTLFSASLRLCVSAVNSRGCLLFVAGMLLGMAGLTRSTALAFVPLVALWLAWVAGRAGAGRVGAPRVAWEAAGRVAGVLLAGVAVLLAPQVVYNVAAYRQVIFGDTSSGYNLWLASVGVKDGPRLLADLAAIPNPGDKQSFAYRQAIAAIAADPAGFVGKGLKESLDLWRINFTSEERQVRGFSEGRVPAAHLWSLLAGEDLLYLLLVLGALLGLATGPPDPVKVLLALWALTWMAMAFVFFAVTRFRFPVVALLLPWAPLGAAYLRRALPTRLAGLAAGGVPRLGRRAAGCAALGGAFLVVVLPTVPWPETATGAATWRAQAPYRQAVPLIAAGRAEQALALLSAADARLPDTQFATDAARLALAVQGAQPDRAALAALAARPEIALSRGSPLSERYEPYLLNGDISRELGQEDVARSAFSARQVHAQGPEAVDWAATFLLPPRGNTLDVGSDLDFGGVQGFYASETVGQGAAGTTFRWSGAESTIRLRPAAPWQTLVLRLSSGRPPGVPAAQVMAGMPEAGATGRGQDAMTFALPPGDAWQEIPLWRLAEPAPAGAAVTITLRVNSFVPGGYDPRALGVRVDWVALR